MAVNLSRATYAWSFCGAPAALGLLSPGISVVLPGHRAARLPISASRRPLSVQAPIMAAGETAAEAAQAIVVYVTVPDKASGQKLASGIIEGKLAACVNRVPGVESVYFWEGKVESSAEELLIIKTRKSLFDSLAAYVRANHPYELPETIALPITAGSEAYLKWVLDNTRDPSSA